MKNLLALFAAILVITLASAASGEPLNTFTITTDEGKSLTLTKDLPAQFFGNYEQTGGRWKWKYHFDKTGETWFMEQTESGNSYSYAASKKIQFTEWGVVVEDGKIREIEGETVREGKDVKLKAMIMIYKRLGEYRSELIYLEKDGSYIVKFASKTK